MLCFFLSTQEPINTTSQLGERCWDVLSVLASHFHHNRATVFVQYLPQQIVSDSFRMEGKTEHDDFWWAEDVSAISSHTSRHTLFLCFCFMSVVHLLRTFGNSRFQKIKNWTINDHAWVYFYCFYLVKGTGLQFSRRRIYAFLHRQKWKDGYGTSLMFDW